jgi:hypothetical protein
MAAVQSNGALDGATRVSIPVRFDQQNTNGLWKTRAEKEFNARVLAKYGCSATQYREVRSLGRKLMAQGFPYERTPLGAFSRQRTYAKKRGVGWEITFWEWWTIWDESGHWNERGTGQGYVMCRVGDSGPYAAWNVRIAPATENNLEGSGKKSGLPIGVSVFQGQFRASRLIDGTLRRTNGHKTPEEAHASYVAMGRGHG